jgi:hypothetical protein
MEAAPQDEKPDANHEPNRDGRVHKAKHDMFDRVAKKRRRAAFKKSETNTRKHHFLSFAPDSRSWRSHRQRMRVRPGALWMNSFFMEITLQSLPA